MLALYITSLGNYPDKDTKWPATGCCRSIINVLFDVEPNFSTYHLIERKLEVSSSPYRETINLSDTPKGGRLPRPASLGTQKQCSSLQSTLTGYLVLPSSLTRLTQFLKYGVASLSSVSFYNSRKWISKIPRLNFNLEDLHFKARLLQLIRNLVDAHSHRLSGKLNF